MRSPSSAPRAGGRADWLDLLKSLLVYGMIAAHVTQLITLRPDPFFAMASEVINLITFSGFMFAFGLGVGLSEGGSGRRSGWVQRLQPAAMLLVGTWLSSLAFVVLVERARLTPDLLIDILSMRRLFGWSEFLASFFVLYLVLLIARPILVFIANRWPLLLAAIAACAASTYLVTSVDFPLLATVIGTRNFASFPLLPYLPWVLLGIYFARRRIEIWHAAVALVATGAYYYVLLGPAEDPSRFPPSILFVAGAAAILLVYLGVSRLLAGAVRLPGFLLTAGRHVFSFLIFSNLIIFSVRRFMSRPLRDDLGVALVAVAIIAALTVLWMVIEAARKGRPVDEAGVTAPPAPGASAGR